VKKRKKVKKSKSPVKYDILIILLVIVLIIAIPFLSNILKTRKTVTTTSTILMTTTTSPVATIPGVQTCSNFTWNIDDVKEFELRKTVTTTSTILMTTTTSPVATIPGVQTCSNFTWNIDDVKEFELRGDYKNVLVNFTVQYIGPEEENYYNGSYQFKILDNDEKYYNPQESYYRCDYENTFRIGMVNPDDRKSGCLEFRILDTNEPLKLIFYDYIVHTLCEIDLS